MLGPTDDGERTRVDEVLSSDWFTQFADKAAALEGLWRVLIHLVLQSDAYATLLSRMLQRGLVDSLLHDVQAIPERHPQLNLLLGRLRPLESLVAWLLRLQTTADLRRLKHLEARSVGGSASEETAT